MSRHYSLFLSDVEADEPNSFLRSKFAPYPGVILKRTVDFQFRKGSRRWPVWEGDVSVHYHAAIPIPSEFLYIDNGHIQLEQGKPKLIGGLATLTTESLQGLLAGPKNTEFLGVDLDGRKNTLEFYVMDGKVYMYPTNIAMSEESERIGDRGGTKEGYFCEYIPAGVPALNGSARAHFKRIFGRKFPSTPDNLRDRLEENLRQFCGGYDGALLRGLVIERDHDPDKPFLIEGVAPDRLVPEVFYGVMGLGKESK